MKWWPFGSNEEPETPSVSQTVSTPAGVKLCRLDASFQTRQELYQSIYDQLGAEEWAGINLDAVYDFLTGMIEGPIEVRWHDIKKAEDRLGGDWVRIADMLRDVAMERSDFTLTLTSAS
jgi:ribonuclease inhibitor